MEKVPAASILFIVAFWKISCVTRGFADVAIMDFRIPTEKLAITTVQSTCICKLKCLYANCTTYSVTRSVAGVECRLSTKPVRRYTWEDNKNSYIVHKSNYQLNGKHFYHHIGSRNRSDADKKCLADGGQLPVLLNKETEDEFSMIMTYFGVATAWIGLFREYTTDASGQITGNQPSMWTLANGTELIATNMEKFEFHTYRCFSYTLQSSDKFNNQGVKIAHRFSMRVADLTMLVTVSANELRSSLKNDNYCKWNCENTFMDVSQSGLYRPPGGVEEMQGGGSRVRLEWGAYITV
ncbi:C-type lectin fold [Trinorchestia longiramus]|nr:C-type lectin fold [Trinorchestia longiramus]